MAWHWECNQWSIKSSSVVGSVLGFVFLAGLGAVMGDWSPGNQQIAVLLEHPTGSNIALRGLRIFTVLEGENHDFDRNDYQVFVEVNRDEIRQQV